jgi:uncharacterized protein
MGEIVLTSAVALIAGTIGGIIGFGSSVMLMPILIYFHGALAAVPIMGVAALMANISRVMVWWRVLDFKVTAVYCASGVPAAALGAMTLTHSQGMWVEIALGLFFLSAVPIRRLMVSRGLKLTLPQMAGIGALIGFLTGFLASTGPVNAPLFLAYGLTKGAFIGTEALASTLTQASKLGVLAINNILTVPLILKGASVGAMLMVGSMIAKRFVLSMSEQFFARLIERVLIVSGLATIALALTHR